MTTNNYAPCPCGSGKKMKFCKCVDQPHEYETIVRLLEGGQEVAALDRINQLLTKSPNAAWLLAMKAELALNLNELDTFRETAQRFLKLKPDNPSALMMRSLVSIMDDEPVENTARTLMDSLAESRESLPALSLIVLTSLCRKLRATPKAPLRFYWFRMLQELRESLPEGEQPGNEPLATDNALAMAPIQVDAPPRSEPWFERMNEVAALESSFRFSQAETKLRSILRDYPDQLVPLVNLLRVQLVLLDQEGAANTARKLGGLRELPEERRDYYAALAMELEPGQPGIRPTSLTRYCEISSDEEVLGALAKLDGLKRMPDDESHDLRAVMAAMVKDEVPAKAAFNVLVQRTTAAGTQYRTLGGMVVVFGRQTDRPPRVLVNLFNAPDCRPAFDAINAAIGQATDLTDPGSPRRFSYIDYLLRARSGQDAQGRPVWLSPDEQDSELIEDFLNLPLPALGDISLLAAVEQEPKRAMVRAVLTHFEAAHQIRLQPGALEKLFQRLGFQRIEQTIDNQEELEKVTDFLGFMRVNVPTVSDSGLHQLLVACLELSLLRPALQAAQELLKRKHVQHPAPLLSGALGLLSQFAQTPEESLSLLEQLENCLSEQGEAVGHIVMQRFQILHSMGMAADADKLLRGALTKYPQDPYLISVMQYAMQQSQQAAGDSVSDRELLSRMTRRPESESESGLVLPGQSSPAEAGKSKLWLPGS